MKRRERLTATERNQYDRVVEWAQMGTNGGIEALEADACVASENEEVGGTGLEPVTPACRAFLGSGQRLVAGVGPHGYALRLPYELRIM